MIIDRAPQIHDINGNNELENHGNESESIQKSWFIYELKSSWNFWRTKNVFATWITKSNKVR